MRQSNSLLFSMLSVFFRFIGGALRAWPITLIAIHFLLPFGVHMRWQYEYVGHYSNKHFVRCDYIGSRGVLEAVTHLPPDCPFFTILDSREWKR